MNSSGIAEKMILGTAQFGMDYGIANLSGKPSKEEVFQILDLVWEYGVRTFDTAPGYGSEVILGEFIMTNGFQNEVKILTKIPSLEDRPDYEKAIKTSIESSLQNLGCTIEVLFFHNPVDSDLLRKNPMFFENLQQEYPVSTLGVSVYEPQEVDDQLDYTIDLAIQFPFNVLDRRFEKVNMPLGKRYARSILLQGLLASPNRLRSKVSQELLNLQKKYHEKLATQDIKPVDFAISFVAKNDAVDYFLIGIDSAKQVQEILTLKVDDKFRMVELEGLQTSIEEKWIDPRKWN